MKGRRARGAASVAFLVGDSRPQERKKHGTPMATSRLFDLRSELSNESSLARSFSLARLRARFDTARSDLIRALGTRFEPADGSMRSVRCPGPINISGPEERE